MDAFYGLIVAKPHICASVLRLVHPLLLLAGLADQSHALCNVQIDAQNVDGFLTENAKQLALRVISHNLFQLLLAQAGGFSQSRNLDLVPLVERYADPTRSRRLSPYRRGCPRG